jgi:hypothetical protein
MKQAVQGLKLDGSNWIFSYRSQGRARRMTIGKFPAVSPKDASKGASILAGQVCCGRDPGAEKKAARITARAASAPVPGGAHRGAISQARQGADSRVHLERNQARFRPGNLAGVARPAPIGNHESRRAEAYRRSREARRAGRRKSVARQPQDFLRLRDRARPDFRLASRRYPAAGARNGPMTSLRPSWPLATGLGSTARAWRTLVGSICFSSTNTS